MTGPKLGPIGITIPSEVPSPTKNMLYNSSGSLMFSGSTIGGKALPFVTVGPLATCDYVTDGTADDVQLQAAIDTLATAGGGIVQLLVANYTLATTVTVKENVKIIGAGIPYRDQSILNGAVAQISQFKIVDTGAVAFIMYCGSAIERCGFYYPNQVTNATPTAYPATIQLAADGATIPRDVYICDNVCTNPYIFCDATTAHERLLFLRNFGSPLYLGLDIDNCSDIDYIEGNHWNPNFGKHLTSTTVQDWMHNNAIGFRIGRCDAGKFINNFAIIYKFGLVLNYTDMLFVSDCLFDSVPYGITATGISNCRITGNDFNSYGTSSILPTDAYSIKLIIGSPAGFGNIVSSNTIVSVADGILCDIPQTVVDGNNCVMINTSGKSNGYGIRIFGYAYNCTVVANIVHGQGNANTFGIVSEPTVGTNISGNNVYACSTSGIFVADGADYYIVANNIIRSSGGQYYGNGAHKLASSSLNVA